MNEPVTPMEVPTPPPPPVAAQGSGKKGFAIASLILGILSLCASLIWFCGGPISVAGVILGFLGLQSPSRKLAIAGLVLSAVGFLLMIIFIVIGLVSGPVIQQLQNQIISNTGY